MSDDEIEPDEPPAAQKTLRKIASRDKKAPDWSKVNDATRMFTHNDPSVNEALKMTSR